jgi:hypothetical protein
MSDETKPPPKASEDVVLLHSPTPDGEGARVVRFRDERVEVGEVRPLKEGKPLAPSGEVVALKPRKGAPWLCDVDVTYRPKPAGNASADRTDTDGATRARGPAQVASPRYRANWESIFGARSDSAASRNAPGDSPARSPVEPPAIEGDPDGRRPSSRRELLN